MCLDLLIYWYLTIYFLIISTSSGDTVDCRRYINVRQITIGSRLTDIMSMHGNYIDYASKSLFFLGIVGIGMLLGIYQLYNCMMLYHCIIVQSSILFEKKRQVMKPVPKPARVGEPPCHHREDWIRCRVFGNQPCASTIYRRPMLPAASWIWRS